MAGGLLATAAASLSALVIDSIYTYVKACISGMPSRNRKLLKDVEQHQIEVDSGKLTLTHEFKLCHLEKSFKRYSEIALW